MVNTSPPGRRVIQEEMDSLKLDLEGYQNNLGETQSKLAAALQQWQDYDSAYDKLSAWVKETERKVKDYGLVSSCDEKKLQLQKYQVSRMCMELTNSFMTTKYFKLWICG